MNGHPTKTTADVLKEMLTENTGRNMLDSGGAYGRHWERNQDRDFEREPESTLEANLWTYQGETRADLSVTHSAYHWLLDRLEYAPEIDAEFQAFAEEEANGEKYWLQLMEEFPQASYRRREAEHDPDGWEMTPEPPTGIYGDSNGPVIDNSYNSEDLLSQTIQLAYWNDERGTIVLLQIHGGCDVRGGYTTPRAFYVSSNSSDETCIFDYGQATIACTNDGEPPINPGQMTIDGEPVDTRCYATWSTGGGFEWNGPGWQEANERYDRMGLSDFPAEEGTEGKPGVVVIDPDERRAFCPVCGRSHLGAWWY